MTVMAEPTSIVDEQFEAYNARDAGRFAAYYADDAIVFDAEGNALVSGVDAIRDFYGGFFEQSPDLRAEIRNRIVLGDVIVDEEEIKGFILEGVPPSLRAVVAYRVRDGKSREVRLLATEPLESG